MTRALPRKNAQLNRAHTPAVGHFQRECVAARISIIALCAGRDRVLDPDFIVTINTIAKTEINSILRGIENCVDRRTVAEVGCTDAGWCLLAKAYEAHNGGCVAAPT